jgi:hypothetical protein
MVKAKHSLSPAQPAMENQDKRYAHVSNPIAV